MLPLKTMVLAATTGFLLFAGCQKEDSGPPPVGDGLAAIEENQSLFSFLYVDDPPEGSRFRIEVHEVDLQGACALHGMDANVDVAAPFWYLTVKTGDIAPGAYEIVPFFGESARSGRAGALLNYVRSSEKIDRYEAVGGELEILEAPQDADEWHTGMKLTARVRVEFPKHIMKTEVCADLWFLGADGGVGFEGTCDCVDVDGHRSTCNLEVTDEGTIPETCCLDLEGPTVAFETEISASPCAEACLWISDLPYLGQYCQALN